MYKFMFCSFAFLGWVFWEMSGGSEFEAPVAQTAAAGELTTYDVAQAGTVTRSRLTANDDTAAVPTPQPASLVVEEPTNEPTDPAMTNEQTASLSSGVDALTEAYTPITTSVISVEPAANVPTTEISNPDIRQVSANRVNMRNGPSTSFDVLDQLGRGDRVEVLTSNDDGWVRLRVEATGQVGWMAERLLTNAAN
ncbi:MAG: SH3 domain-containing protein [Planktomarina sp.]